MWFSDILSLLQILLVSVALLQVLSVVVAFLVQLLLVFAWLYVLYNLYQELQPPQWSVFPTAKPGSRMGKDGQ
jgi:hypothetical protein